MEASLAAAVTGINGEQTQLDVVANNLANADTVGFKQSSVTFSDLLTQVATGATAPVPPARGGVNPIVIGAGAQVAAVTPDFAEGSLSQTGVASNAAIEGNGFFVVDNGGTQSFSRAGAFQVDAAGNLVAPDGAIVQGWPSVNGVVNPTGPTGPLVIPTGQQIAPTATSLVNLGGNLQSGKTTAQVGTVTAYDSQGRAFTIDLSFTPTGTANQWSVNGSVANPAGGTTSLWSTGAPVVTFGANGQVSNVTMGGAAVAPGANGGWTLQAQNLPVGYNWAAGSTLSLAVPAPGATQALTQQAQSESAGATSQNGSAAGVLNSYSIGSSGVITGSFSNGQTQPIGQIAMAVFANPAGLVNQGNGLFSVSANSGVPLIGTPGSGGRGTLVGGAVEQSNTNLATEMTKLVDAQTNYVADTKVVSTTQQVLAALTQMVP